MAHTLIGTVTSAKRDKTITVSIVSRETHPLYRKQYTKTRKYTAHDEKNEAHEGDRVQITIRPSRSPLLPATSSSVPSTANMP